MNIVAHIPARYGSERIKVKNLKLLAGKPLLSYAINAAKKSKKITDFYVNTESESIAEYARSCNAKVFLRDVALAGADITQDTFNYDFISKIDADILVLINPVCPLIDGADIDSAIDQLFSENLDTVVSVLPIQLHCIFKNLPLNFDNSVVISKTQDLEPVLACNWAIGVWKVSRFKEQFEKHRHALLVGKTGYFRLPPIKSVKISTEEDFILAEAIIKGLKK